jgi:hypothetical protein
MDYQSHHYSATLRCSICISVFCTLLVLSVFLPFMLSVSCPFNAPFPFYTFLLLHSSSFFTPQSHSTTTPISSLFNILILSVHLLHAICFSLLHPLLPNLIHIRVFFPLYSSHLLYFTFLHLLLIVSALLDHHGNSLASLAVSPTHPSSLGVISRFLSFSGSCDSLSSLS